jgi:hypothetical protein
MTIATIIGSNIYNDAHIVYFIGLSAGFLTPNPKIMIAA